MNEIVLDTIDEKMLLTPSVTREIRLPEGVTNVSDINMATVNVKHVGTSTFRYNVSDIIYVNPNSIEFAPLTESISVTLRGPSETVGSLSSENIVVTADLSSLKVGQGVVDLPVSISVRGEGSNGCYEIGSYVINVSV
jgi:YbbR domain-containing protein